MTRVPGRWRRRLGAKVGLFKRPALFVAVLIGAGVVTSPVDAQAPDEDWRTITTEHFRVTFPERLEPLARRAADRAEWSYDVLEEALIEPPDGLIDLVVTDHTDISNGFATVHPSNRITVYARPPIDLPSLGYFDDWMELVVLHELAHIVHLDDVTNPVGRLARAVFGRVSAEWPFFISLGTPRWLTEGLATWYESRLTASGRTRGTYQEMQLRTALLEGRFEGIGEASGDSPLWPSGTRPYTYGARFFAHLLGKYGEERMVDFVEAVSGQWIPYRMNAAGRSAFGASLSDEWDAWEATLRAELEDLDAELEAHGPITEPERLTSDARWGLHPKVSPDGAALVYVRADGRSDAQLRIDDPAGGTPRKLTRTNGLGTFTWLPDGRLALAQLELDGPYRSYGDLYVVDRSGDQRRVTRQARLTDPSAFPDGRSVVAVQQGDGTNGLVTVDLSSGDISALVEPDPAVHWALPTVSPNGRWIAVSRWTENAYMDVVVLDASDGSVVHELTDDRAIDIAPSWGPESDWLVWASDRSGIWNIYGVELDGAAAPTGDLRMLTNVRTGAAFPSIDPTGSWLYFSGYHVDGWDVERVRFDGASAAQASAAQTRFAPPTTPILRGSSVEPVEPYRPGPSLAPTYWEFSWRDEIVFPAARDTVRDYFLPSRTGFGPAIGIQTAGRDLVGRHSYSLYGRMFTESTRVEAGFLYTFSGLGNQRLSLSVTQGFEALQQILGDQDPDTLLVLDRRRGVQAAITLLAPRWRHDFAVTGSAGYAWQDAELLGTDFETPTGYSLTRPARRFGELGLSASFVTARSHAFQMGITRGLSLFASTQLRRELSLPGSLRSVAGQDGSRLSTIGRARAAVPLWQTGRVTHVLAFQAVGGVASGPGASRGTYLVGGASGRPESVTGAELFGGSFILFPVRGYQRTDRFGRFAWSASAEYRFPIGLLNRGVGAWPLYFDRIIGSLFVDAGNAWGPDIDAFGQINPLRSALASVGAEITTETQARFDIRLRVRTGIAFPLVDRSGATGYVRVGLPF